MNTALSMVFVPFKHSSTTGAMSVARFDYHLEFQQVGKYSKNLGWNGLMDLSFDKVWNGPKPARLCKPAKQITLNNLASGVWVPTFRQSLPAELRRWFLDFGPFMPFHALSCPFNGGIHHA